MTGTVLVVTSTDDHTSDLIVSALHHRGARVVRLDPGAGPVHIAAGLDGLEWRGEVADEHRAARLEDVVGVLWRWPTPPAGHPNILDPARRKWAAREDALGLHGVLKSLPVRWINHPDTAAAANSKPGQLITARACGLTVPRTLITNSGLTARSWTAKCGEVLYKAFKADGADQDAMVVASPVTAADLPDELGAVSMFQQVIRGRNVRLTMVGDQAYAAAISDTDELDWRPVQDELTYTPIVVPSDVLDNVRAFMRRYGLEYGAFDFIIAADGRWVFLECNPTGMYGWIEIKTQLPISAAIAARLCTRVESADRIPSTLAEW